MAKLKFFSFLIACYIAVLQGGSLETIDENIIEKQPSDQEVRIGDNVTLECVWSFPGTGCQWTKDSIKVNVGTSRYQLPSSNSGNCSLTILSFQPMDEGKWQCSVTSTLHAQTVQSREALLSLIKLGYVGPRNFISEPNSQNVTTSSNATLECIFNTLSPNCYWIKDGDVIMINGRYSFTGDKSTGDCSIQITDVKLFDSGLWQCGYPRTDSEEALKSEIVYLSVAVPPSEPVIVINGVAMKNGQKLYLSTLNPPFQLSCWSENGSPAAQLEWGVKTHSTYQRLTDNQSRDTLYGRRPYHYNSGNNKQQTKVYISTMHETLKIAELPFKFSYNGEWQQCELICNASHPTYGESNHITSIQLIMAYP